MRKCFTHVGAGTQVALWDGSIWIRSTAAGSSGSSGRAHSNKSITGLLLGSWEGSSGWSGGPVLGLLVDDGALCCSPPVAEGKGKVGSLGKGAMWRICSWMQQMKGGSD